MNIDFYKNIVEKYPEEFKLFRGKIQISKAVHSRPKTVND